ncbi:hypothetical protein [Pararhizobium gei]|uniref:hypothetical protein n=1 Tax=Pararhizobium gei TaxID=1395951 RepID=UPI0023DA2145|nr:hypothetical protein [Rhizobium gei]
MSATTDFVAELYRAANEVRKLTPFERRRLIERAVATVRDLREQSGKTDGPSDKGLLSEIALLAKEVAGVPDQVVSHGLLVAADMIRTLRVELDAKTRVHRTE